MSKIKFTANGSGSATFDIQSPNTSTDRTITIPDKAGGLALGAGTIVQITQVTKTDTFEVTGSTYTDVTGMSVSITPTSASNKILVLLHVHYSGGQNAGPGIKLFRGSTQIHMGDTASGRDTVTCGGEDLTNTDNGNYTIQMGSATFLDSPATTSSTTYKIQLRGRDSFGAGYSNRTQTDLDDVHSGKRTASSITLLEVQA